MPLSQIRSIIVSLILPLTLCLASPDAAVAPCATPPFPRYSRALSVTRGPRPVPSHHRVAQVRRLLERVRPSVVTDALVFSISSHRSSATATPATADDNQSSFDAFDASPGGAALRIRYLRGASGGAGGVRATSLLAQRVIYAAPLFSAPRVIEGWNASWLADFTYAPWLVANLHLRGRPDGYERCARAHAHRSGHTRTHRTDASHTRGSAACCVGVASFSDGPALTAAQVRQRDLSLAVARLHHLAPLRLARGARCAP